MIRIILCEGETDLTLLGLYLEKVCGWTYEKSPTWSIRIPKTRPLNNEKAENYARGSDVLKICCVGGKDNFGLFYEKYLHRILVSSQNKENDFRIALMTDADNRTAEEIQSDILMQLSPYLSDIENNVWKHNNIQNSFNESVNVDFLLTIIPKQGAGALETVLMDSLAEMKDGESIVSNSKNFIDNLPENDYIPTDRLKLKSMLGVALSVIYPDKVFSQFDKQLEIVDWSKSDVLSECLSELVKI